SAFAASRAVAYAADAVAYAADAAVAAEYDLWLDVRRDANAALSAQSPQETPLWLDANPLKAFWETAQTRMSAAAQKGAGAKTNSGDWTFWIDWYTAHLAGKPLPIHLLEDIVQLPEDLWVNNPAKLHARVMEFYDAWKRSRGRAQSQELLHAAITQFEYDVAERLMRAIPFEEDWRELEDPDLLAEMLKDVASFRKAMDRLKRSLEYEGGARQGGGPIRAYLEDIELEFTQAEEVGKLLVGEIVELRRSLEGLSKREELRAELGHFCEPLDDILRKLSDILQKHFASTLSRFSVLRDVELEEDANPWEVLTTMRDVVEGMRSGAMGELPRLLKKDAESLDLLLDDLERLIRELENAKSAQQVSSLQREINFAMAKILASGSLYVEQANEALPRFSGKAKKVNETIDSATKIERRTIKVAEWADRLSDVFEKF
ncbi:MAG: hypothetical protein AAFR53_08710, partial [Pseudomonadota bacterium]